jgi:hypothetical protein
MDIPDFEERHERLERHWEDFLARQTGVMLSHGCCPDCFEGR